MDELKPILLFGMPRSGTTWLGKVFDSHPDTLYRHEPDSGGALDGQMPLLAETDDVERFRDAVESFLATLPGDDRLRVTGKLPVFPKRYQPAGAATLRRLLLFAAKGLSPRIPIERVPEFVRHDDGSVRLVWKSIESLGRLGVFARLLPEARGIQIVRHPCGYVASVLRGEARGLLPGSRPTSEDYGVFDMLLETAPAKRRGLDRSFLEGLEPVERLAWRWLLFNEKALEDIEPLENARAVSYESLCEAPVDGYRALFDFVGLSWERQTEDFLAASTHNERSAYFSVYKNPLEAANRWQRELDLRAQEAVLKIVADTAPGRLFGI